MMSSRIQSCNHGNNHQPFVPRFLEEANGVEKNPGPVSDEPSTSSSSSSSSSSSLSSTPDDGGNLSIDMTNDLMRQIMLRLDMIESRVSTLQRSVEEDTDSFDSADEAYDIELPTNDDQNSSDDHDDFFSFPDDMDEDIPLTRRRHRNHGTISNPQSFPTIRYGNIGIFVKNSTDFNITVKLSMKATHYFENNVGPGEIYYEWPGAVWYTVSVHPTGIMGKMTKTKRERELATAIGVGVGLGALAAGTIALPLALAPIEVGIVDTVAGTVAGEGIAAAVGKGADAACKVGKQGYDMMQKATSSTKDKAAVILSLMDKFKNLREKTDVTRLEDVASASMGWKISDRDAASIRRKYGKGHVKAFEMDALQAVKDSTLSTFKRGVYAGNIVRRDGAFLEVTGLPTVVTRNGRVKIVGRDIFLDEYEDFEIYKTKLEEEKFTAKSYRNYFKQKKPGL